jgi:hypothetical protein
LFAVFKKGITKKLIAPAIAVDRTIAVEFASDPWQDN